MLRHLLVVFIRILLTFAVRFPNINQRIWDYTIISASVNTSDTNLVEVDARVITLGRGRYVVSGYLDVKVPIDNNSYVEVSSYRSATGNSNYKLINSFGKRNITVSSFMNELYKPYVMEEIRECSNAPQFNGTWVCCRMKPIRYSFDKCIISADRFQPFMLPGYYKIVISFITDKCQVHANCIVRIEHLV